MADIAINTWTPKIPIMNKADIVRFQFMVHCHIEKIHISKADLDCLTLLGLAGKPELMPFCDRLSELRIFKSSQSARNAITRLQDKHLILKEGRNKKKLYAHPDLKIQNTGNVMVEVRCFSPNKDIDGTN